MNKLDRNEKIFKILLDEYPREVILAGLNEMSRLNKEGLFSFGVIRDQIKKKNPKPNQ